MKRSPPLRWRAAEMVLPLYIVAALLLGGASAAGVLANLLLQLAAIVVIAIGLMRKPPRDPAPASVPTALRIVIVLAFAWPLIQLIPLPPAIWHLLPGREAVVANDTRLGMDDVWRPISLQPNQTLASLLSMLVPLAAFALALKASERSRWAAIGGIVAVAIISVLIGIVQIAQGPDGQAYIYAITTANASVGFFANSNHLGTLLVIAAACALCFPPSFGQRAPTLGPTARIVLFAFFLVGIAINRSFAGYGMALLLTLYASSRAILALSPRTRLMTIGGGAIATAALGIFLLSPSGHATLSGFMVGSTDPNERLTFYRNTIAIFRDTFPFGTGLGSFVAVYAGVEPLQGITVVYVNHAHSDYLELASDLGAVGPVMIGIFAFWYVSALRHARSAPAYFETAALAIASIALHSLIDYPARTAAIASIGAMFVAFMLRRPAQEPPA